jgi:hypothetical protein
MYELLGPGGPGVWYFICLHAEIKSRKGLRMCDVVVFKVKSVRTSGLELIVSLYVCSA